MTHEYLAEQLGGTRDTEHFRLHYPRGMDREAVERLSRDLEFRHHQLSQFLGGAPTERIHVYLYKTEEEKQALVGAGRTQFAKPWLAELHINDKPFPHTSLHHELAHVMAGPAGSGPFRVTTRLGLWPLMGVIEGFAVAADDPIQGELTLHQWAAGMRRQKLAPDMRKLMGTEGFYQSAPSRAYTVAGSFLRFLADTYGPEKVRALYAHADFQRAYGRPLDELVTEWERYVDALPLDEAAISRAFLRFRTGALFTRACAREVARLQKTAQEALASDPQEALELYRRATELQPEEPTYPMGQAIALDQLDRTTEAAQLLATLAAQPKVKEQPALEAEVVMDQADMALRLNQLAEAQGYLERVLASGAQPRADALGPDQARLAGLALAPEHGGALLPLASGGAAPAVPLPRAGDGPGGPLPELPARTEAAAGGRSHPGHGAPVPGPGLRHRAPARGHPPGGLEDAGGVLLPGRGLRRGAARGGRSARFRTCLPQGGR